MPVLFHVQWKLSLFHIKTVTSTCVVDFLRKTLNLYRISSKKSYNNNTKPWKSYRILRPNLRRFRLFQCFFVSFCMFSFLHSSVFHFSLFFISSFFRFSSFFHFFNFSLSFPCFSCFCHLFFFFLKKIVLCFVLIFFNKKALFFCFPFLFFPSSFSFSFSVFFSFSFVSRPSRRQHQKKNVAKSLL